MRYSLVSVLLGILIIINIVSCNTTERIIDLWPEGKIPNQKETSVEEVHEFTDILRISKVHKPTIEVFLPDKSIATGQALLIFPGGGYQILAYDKEGTNIAKFLTERGIAGIVVKYRLPSDDYQTHKHKVPLIDAQRAIRIVRSRAGEWNIDSKQIGIIGFSAGGHLASTLGTKYNQTMYLPIDEIDELSARPDFMALLYPVITMREKTHKGSRDNLLGENATEDLIMKYSSENQITESTPPTYVVHAMDDTVVPVANSEYFNTMHNLKSNAGCTLYLFEKGGHGFGLAQDDTVLKQWPFNLIEWMNSLETE